MRESAWRTTSRAAFASAERVAGRAQFEDQLAKLAQILAVRNVCDRRDVIFERVVSRRFGDADDFEIGGVRAASRC